MLGDLEHVTGDHNWKGALLAAEEINEAGGIDIYGNGTNHYIGLAAEDTDEANETLVVSKGVAAANRMISYNDPHFIIGGFRNESVSAYLEPVMDAQIPFLGTGIADNEFCQKVNDSYNRYKYIFRVMPMNSTSLGVAILYYIGHLTQGLSVQYGGTLNKVAILREDLPWTEGLSFMLNYYLPDWFLTVEEEIAFPIDATEEDFNIYWNTIDSAGVQLTIPIVSSRAAITMVKSYRENKPKCLLAGINVLAQLDSYWDDTEGACQYEILMQAIHRTDKTPKTIPFWDSFVEKYNIEPYYIGVGSYDAVRLLANVSDSINSFNSDDIVIALEEFNQTNSFIGVSCNIAFTNAHDLVEGYPYAFTLFCQWQLDGSKVVVRSYVPSPNPGYYPTSLATGPISVPYWGINNLVAAQDLPGNFSLDSTAESPDPDGSFNLTWSNSVGADNYSVYLYDKPITYINKSLTLLANQNATTPFSISGLESGDYFFVVVAYNETGETLSNNVNVTVELPGPGAFTLTSDADSPDIDGAFNLTWTASDGADNYSVFSYNRFITWINDSTTIYANQSAIPPFPIIELESGDYYFVVVAYNEAGDTLSNNLYVKVDPSGYWILNPLIIDDTGTGDYTWSQVATQPWCSGSGTSVNPYILETLKIDGKNSENCIIIRNSKIYFTIKDSVLYNSGSNSNHGGLKLVSVSNGELISNNCSRNNANGIILDSCHDIDMSVNSVSQNELSGILLINSTNINIKNNNETINQNKLYGIYLDNSHNNDITGNTINYNRIGIYFYESNYNTIANNDLRYNDKPYEEVDCVGNTFENNLGIRRETPFPFDILLIILIVVIAIVGVIAAALIVKKRISMPEKKEKEISESKKQKIRRKLEEKLNFVDHLIKENKIKLAYKNLGKVKDTADQYEFFDIFNKANEKVEICKEVEAGIYKEVKKEDIVLPRVAQVEEKVKEEKEIIPVIEKRKEFNIFLSYSTLDSIRFQIDKIAKNLEKFPEIKKVYYYSKDSGQNIVEYMEETLSVCNIFVLFCTKHSKKSKAVEGEWQSAYQLVKKNIMKIIPVYEDEEDVPILLIPMLNVRYDKEDFNGFINKLYQEILR